MAGVIARRSAPRAVRLPRLQSAWLTLAVVCLAGVIVDRVHPLPNRASGSLAVAIAALVVAGLWARAGARASIAVAVTVLYGGVAVGLQNTVMLRGAAVVTAAAVAVFAVLVTVPAARFGRVVVEVVIADLIATAGGIAVAAYHVNVDGTAFRYVALMLAFLGAFVAVYRPGAGLHGLGRRGYVLIGSIAGLVVFAIAYSLALTHWGSHYFVASVDDLRNWTHDSLGAAPHVLEVLIGVPSLCWGVFTRARRRQGWWMCAFGVTLTCSAATSFIGGSLTRVALLGGLYSLILGVIVGFAVVRGEQFFTGSRGTRARRSEEAAAHRPEPKRWAALR